jgi:hypothetical protein
MLLPSKNRKGTPGPWLIFHHRNPLRFGFAAWLDFNTLGRKQEKNPIVLRQIPSHSFASCCFRKAPSLKSNTSRHWRAPGRVTLTSRPVSERKQSLVTDMVAKQEKVTELQQGGVIPLNALLVVRLWHRKPDLLAARCAALKNAFISMGGAVVHTETEYSNHPCSTRRRLDASVHQLG